MKNNKFLTEKQLKTINSIAHLDKLHDSLKKINKDYSNFDNFIKKITSKKGTTQEGINYLEDANIEKIMYNTFNKAYKRSKELSLEK